MIEVRKIYFKDIIALTKICRKIDIKSIIEKYRKTLVLDNVDVNTETGEVTETDEKKKIEEKGIEIVIDLLCNAGDAEQEIYQLIGSLSNIKSKDVEKWSLADIKEFYTQFMKINDMEEIQSFFSQATN